MDILDESFGDDQTFPVESLENMVETSTLPPNRYPQAAVRNRAATTAILTSDPDKMVENYRLMMQEAAEGKEVTHQMALESIQAKNKSKDMTHVIAILGDKSIPLEQKKALMNFVQTEGFKEDPSVTLQSQALIAENKGEDLRGEAARISTADVMREMQSERDNRQKLVNNFMATLPEDAAKGQFIADLTAAEVMPFGRNKIAADVSSSVNQKIGVPKSFGGWLKDFLLPGSSDRDLQAKLMAIPPENREAHTKLILDGIKDSAAVFSKDNYYAQFSKAVKLLDSPMQSDGAVWTENLMTVLDAFWVGSEFRAIKMGLAGAKPAQEFASRARKPGSAGPAVSDAEYVEKASWELVGDPYNPNQIASGTKRLTGPSTKVEDEVRRLSVNSVVRRENPASPYSIVEQVNPSQARNMHNAIVAGTDETAEALTGVSREQAIINNVFPQAGTESGSVLAKVDQSITDALTNTGATRYTAGEFDQAVANVTRDFRNATGLEINDAMTTIRVDGDHLLIDAHYGHAGGTFHSASEARAQAKFALKGYGIRDDEIIVMQREGGSYVPKQEPEFTVKWNEDEYQFIATDKNGNKIGELAPGSQAQKNGKTIVADTSVDEAWRGKGVGGAMYEAYAKKYNGNITPGMTSEAAWKVWLNKFPQKSVEYIREEATKFIDNVKSGNYSDEYEKQIFEGWEGAAGKYFKEAVETMKAGKEWTGESLHRAARPPTNRSTPPLLPDADYIIKVQTKQPISDVQVDNWNPLDVKRNFTDRIAQTGTENRGAISGWLMDPGSMLHPTLTGSASIASDQAINFENILLKPIKELRSEIGSFKADRVAKIEQYMVEANVKGIKHDAFDLTARGFTQPEIASLKKWKDIWDGHYYLENNDLVRTLNSQNFQLFENANTKLFARPLLQKNGNIGKVYDPASDSVVSLSKAEMDSLYDLGGHYATLRRPLDVAGETVEHMVVRNTPSEYLRKVRDTDSVLNYREGYYTINYKAPKFIDEIVVDGAGKEIRRTVAVAGNTKDADMFVQSQTQASGNRHVIREDSRGFKKDGDGYWDVNEASGRISQRLRGKPLTEAKGNNILGSGSFVENPMESAIRAAKSLSGRSVSRPMLETAKKRFVSQYSDMLPSDGMGGKRWPINRNEIVDHGSHTSSQLADARTTYGYINFLEDGYINSADEIFKGGMNVLADLLGKYHLSGAERAARHIGNKAPTNLAKGTVFQAYIAMSNPIRQWIVQSHQAGRMAAYNPAGFINGGWAQRMGGYLQITGDLGTPSALARDFHKFVTDSGMVAGVDRNSLVRGLGLSMADSSSKTKRVAGEILALPQTIGFDIGEKVNQLGHLASVHEKWTRAGKDLADKTVRDLALSEARALSYDLNKAGELTYTQSTPAMILQFLQMPHKAILQATNRKLPLTVRARMMAWDLIMFGAPTGTIGYFMTKAGADGGDILPDDEEHRDMFVDGLEAWAMNKVITMMDDSGEKTRIDFSALAPNSMDGWARMYSSLVDDGAFAALAASPAGQLFAVDGVNGSRRNGRIPTALLTMGRFFNVVDEMDPNDPTAFTDIVRDVAKITSGWSAADNALLMLETRKKQDATGVVVDSSITTPEIAAAFLGFGTKSSKELYEISKNRATEKKKHEEQVMSKYRDIVTYYKQELNTENGNIEHVQKVSSMLLRTFDDPYDRALVVAQWQKDLVGKESSLFKTMLDASGMPGADKLMDDIRKWPVDDNTKNQMIQRVKDFKAQREINKGN